MSGGSTNNASSKKCGMYELIIFLAAIITGSSCSICSKTMMQLHSIGITGNDETFTKPIFQTLGMFVGMTFGLIMHFTVLFFKIPFPGYHHPPNTTSINGSHSSNNNNSKGSVLPTLAIPTEKDSLLKNQSTLNSTNTTTKDSNNVPIWMYFFLSIPSIFDLAATALCMMGLRYLDVSIYQLLRGSGIIFVALMKQHVLKDHLYSFQWVGVIFNVVSVVFVGTAAILNSENDDASGTSSTTEMYGGSEALLGIGLVMSGAFIQALQFVFEEKVMAMDEAAAPPLLLIGMEGLWGTVLCLFVVYPLAYYLPGKDHGRYEDPFNTYHMIMNSSTIQWAFLAYFLVIFAYNLFAVLVTFSLNSIWHAILDNFRPITVWGTDMFIYYALVSLKGDFGEPWTKYSWVQLLGMIVLLYGTAIYNAPNAGSVSLRGQWYAFGINLTHEYDEIEMEESEAAIDREFEERALATKRRVSSFAEYSPYINMQTQAIH
jgi:multidrug transporter EmrE-like cation transporter